MTTSNTDSSNNTTNKSEAVEFGLISLTDIIEPINDSVNDYNLFVDRRDRIHLARDEIIALNNSHQALLKKPTKHEIFLRIVENLALFSKCVSKQVGCIAVRDNRILSSGVNGTPSGVVNCCDYFNEDPTFDISRKECRSLHHSFSEAIECHAEENAIINAAKHGISLDGSTFYITLKPCERCLKMIAALGIKYIYYRNEYDMFVEYSEPTQRMIKELNINIQKI